MHELLNYYHDIQTSVPKDIPEKAAGNDVVSIGFAQLWRAIHMRRFINNSYTVEQRRDLEAVIREQMTDLKDTDPENTQTWWDLYYIHHWSVTADQAEMIAAVF